MSTLTRLLRPSSVAVLGASPTPGKVGHRCLEVLDRFGFTGRVLPINPGYTEIGRWPCYASVDALPDAVDLMIAAIPKAALMSGDVLASVARKARNLVVFASGFADRGAADDQRLLADLARHGVGVLGPNTMGFINRPSNVAATFAPSIRIPAADVPFRPIAILSHSGGVVTRVFNRLCDIGLAPAYCVSTGNEAGYTLADLIHEETLLAECSMLLLYVENLNAGTQLFEAIADAADARRRVVVLLGGLTAAGSAAARSHTGAITPDLRAAAALFREAGAHIARSVDELVDAATVTVSSWSARGRDLAIVANSGGRAVLASDAAEAADLSLPPLSFGPGTGLPAGSYPNPVDVTAFGTPVEAGELVRALVSDPTVDAVLVEVGQTQWPAIARSVRESAKPVVFEMADATTDEIRTAIGWGVPAFASVDRAVGSIRFTRPRSPLRIRSSASATAVGDASDLLHSEVLARIRDMGLRVVPYRRVTDERQALEALSEFGVPTVVKGDVRGPVHKTEQSAIRTGLRDEDGFRAACAELLHRWGAVIVQPQLRARLELLVGGKRIGRAGRVAVVGIGGLLAELSVLRPAIFGLPTDPDRFRRQLALLAEEEPRTYRLLKGYRGLSIGVNSLVSVLTAVDALLAQFTEVDLNPVFVSDAGEMTVIDCRVA